jgi:hypothetical protein
MEHFVDAFHRGAAPANIISRFPAIGIMPFNAEVTLESQFAIDPIELALSTIHRTRAEINETVPAFPSGLHFLSRHELRRPMEDAYHNLNYDRSEKILKGTR